MSNRISRRRFLELSLVAAAGTALASCTPKTTETAAPPAAATAVPPAAATAVPPAATAVPPVEEVTLDCMSLAEYNSQYQEIWNVFAGENPGITINCFAINEDTAAAFEAKVAGGYIPNIDLTQEEQIFFNKTNYEMAYDLSKMDFPWWDKFTFDALHEWSNLHGLPGPRSLDMFQGYVFTWQFNNDLMKLAGLDPQKDVKTMDDLYKWMDEGTAWAKSSGQADYFWHQAWHNLADVWFSEMFTVAWKDGTNEKVRDCWLGKAKFTDETSPYRHVMQFWLDAKDKGWITPDFTTLLWENDMEASYIGGKTVMMGHGPWVWDKAKAAGATFEQSGLPFTPPADADAWYQAALPPNIDNQWWMRAGVDALPTWPQTQLAWNWFFSPEAIPMRADAEGRFPLYTTDEPVVLNAGQFAAVLKYIGDPNGPYPNSKWTQEQTGNVLSSPYRLKGSKGVWDWESNGNNEYWTKLFSGEWTVQNFLEQMQKNWDESYEGLPAA